VSTLPASIVINTFNRAESLRTTIEALTQLDYPLFEIVVVNGPSTDGTSELLDQFSGQIKMETIEVQNLSASRNVGLAAAKGTIVAFIDDDAYPDPAWLNCLAEAFGNDEVAAAGGPTYDHTGYALQARYSLATRMGRTWEIRGEVAVPPDALNRPHSHVFPYTIGTNSCFRRAYVIEVGGFDEEFEYYYDETDLCVRLIDRGYVVKALECGFVYHKCLPSERRPAARVLRDRFTAVKNHVYFALKHGRATRSFADICSSMIDFVEDQRKDYRWCISNGWLSESDYATFESDIPRAFDVGFSRIAEGRERTRPAEWFAEREKPFLPFRTRRPKGEKLHLCFVSKEYPAGVVNGSARFTHMIAPWLAKRGHYVHALTRGTLHHRVDLEESVWVHRMATGRHTRPLEPQVSQNRWNRSASLYEEVLRIHQHRPVDFIVASILDSEGLAALVGKTVPMVISLHGAFATPRENRRNWETDRDARRDIMRPLTAVERFCLKNCHAILANSSAIIDELERVCNIRFDPEKVHVDNATQVHTRADKQGDLESIERFFTSLAKCGCGVHVHENA